jgi:hypothetical protein
MGARLGPVQTTAQEQMPAKQHELAKTRREMLNWATAALQVEVKGERPWQEGTALLGQVRVVALERSKVTLHH